LSPEVPVRAILGCLWALGCAGDDPDRPVPEPDPVEDGDGDGVVPPEDCDDGDAGVFPGAPDPFYDGVDSDCGGNDDYDQDGDGHASDEHGGDYCYDANPAISPTSP
jgi:hypothetical protein